MFPLKFDDEVRTVSKISAADFSPRHHELLSQIRYEQNELIIPDNQWRSLFLTVSIKSTLMTSGLNLGQQPLPVSGCS
jgi:hypothetical protein